ncbi:DUF732 domain-containing protein [Sinomonas sp. P10A9]|uniref:DUF732 domain-containing protein n=1 Tax=Sinomonas puerhi TaxID=3238584 RepID=A0AB39L0W1_9MICC
MENKVAAAAALGVLLLMTGCAAGPSPAEQSASASAQAEQVFRELWHKQFPDGNQDSGVALAKSVCDSYRAGTSLRDEAAYLMATMKVSAGDAGSIIGLATSAYCPEYNARH